MERCSAHFTSGVIKKIYDFSSGSVGYHPRRESFRHPTAICMARVAAAGGDDSGAIYQLTLGGVATLEGSFTFATGYGPVGALVQGSDGRLYVTSQSGGGTNSGGVSDAGAIDVFNGGLAAPKPGIFRITPTSGGPSNHQSGAVYRRDRGEVQWHLGHIQSKRLRIHHDDRTSGGDQRHDLGDYTRGHGRKQAELHGLAMT